MQDKKLTVILPSAGEGTRLGLPYAKEIHMLSPSQSLIDFSLNLFKENTKNEVSFAVTITSKKLDLIAYLAKYSNKFQFLFTYFDDRYKDLPGSIRSAETLMGDRNLVLLPDTLIKVDFSIYDELIKALDTNECVIFYKKSSDVNYMISKGCVEVSDSQRLIGYADKPKEIARFNGVWCGIGFTKNAYASVIDAVEAATLKMSNFSELFEKSKMNNAHCIAVDDFIDLGTWQDISKYQSSF